MALDKHGRTQRYPEFVRQVCYSFFLMVPATVGQEYEWDSLGLEKGQGLMSARDGIVTAYQDTIYTVSY